MTLDGLEIRRDVYIIAATNRLELIDDAMLRPGRLGKLLYVPLPSPSDRVSILRALAKKVHLASDVDVEAIGLDERCRGFSGADLAALLREAGLAVIREMASTQPLGPSEGSIQVVATAEGTENINKGREEDGTMISARHFQTAFEKVRPSVPSLDQRR